MMRVNSKFIFSTLTCFLIFGFLACKKTISIDGENKVEREVYKSYNINPIAPDSAGMCSTAVELASNIKHEKVCL
jgi:hypothetical protein